MDPSEMWSVEDLFTRVRRGRPVRVAYLTPLLGPGGSERQMLMLAASLPRSMFEVSFLLMSERGSLAREAESMGLAVDVLGQRRDRRRGGGLQLRGGLDTSGFQVSTPDPRYRRGRCLALSGVYLRRSGPTRGARARCYSPAEGRCSTSTGLAADTGIWAPRWPCAMSTLWSRTLAPLRSKPSTEEGIPRERVHVIHNAVTTVPTSDILRRKLRAGWGSSDLNVVVGSVGNFRPGKGHDMLLDLAERLRTVDTSIRYVLVGSGPLRPSAGAGDHPETAQ